MLANAAAAALCSVCTLQLISQMLLHKVLPFLVPQPACFLASGGSLFDLPAGGHPAMPCPNLCHARPGQPFVVSAALSCMP
jgi:hypothetical protein